MIATMLDLLSPDPQAVDEDEDLDVLWPDEARA